MPNAAAYPCVQQRSKRLEDSLHLVGSKERDVKQNKFETYSTYEDATVSASRKDELTLQAPQKLPLRRGPPW